MNNSEPAVVVSSNDVFAEQKAHHLYQFPSAQSLNDRLQGDQSFHHSDPMNGNTGSNYLQSNAVQETQSAQRAKLYTWPDTRLDFGFWLLCGSATRQNRWNYLRKLSRENDKANDLISKRSLEIVKRSYDVIASIFLLITLSPLLFLISILIKVDSSGSVFFRHYRVGKNGKNFILWKFRSMKTDVPQYATSPLTVADERLTRVGRLIRRLSIDEIPQLINVLKGEMSLVGPRPEMPFIVERFHPANCDRLSVRPGITGLWQISPARAFPIHENLHYDLHYVRNQNLILDCTIILRTIAAVIHGVGAV